MVLCFSLLLAAAARAQDEAFTVVPGGPLGPAEAEEGEADGTPAVHIGSGHTLLIFPPGDLYPQYIADPHRVGFGIQQMSFSETEIAESGDSRIGLKAGGRFGFVRIYPSNRVDRGWQLSIEGGFDAQFDLDHSYDNIGWDGNYGLLLTAAPVRGLAFKLGMHHTSSHVGDEYAERTGRRRIDYTRHELAAGISWAMDEHWRYYAEAGWGYYLNNDDLQEPGRMQLGLEFEDAKSLWKRRLGWYVALDASAMEERDWRVDTSLQLGLVLRSGGRIWRLGIERYDGRPTIGEFFQDDETYIAMGLWLDV
jgi:hypothetical protein